WWCPMTCKICQAEAIGACRACGGFYCAEHGGASPIGPRCATCYDDSRARMGFGAVMFVAGGIVALILSFTLGPYALLGVVVSLLPFGLAALFAWCAVQRFPSRH